MSRFSTVIYLCLGATCAWAANRALPGSGSDLAGGWLVAGILLGWLGAAFFTILDYIFFTFDSEEIEAFSRMRPKAGALFQSMRRDLDRIWLALLSGRLVFSILLGLALVAAVRSFFPNDNGLVSVLAILAGGTGILLLGEIIPALIAARYFRSLSLFSARAVQVAGIVLFPLTIIPLLVLRGLNLLLGVDSEDRLSALEVEKRLLTYVGVGEADVTFETEEREMIDHAIEFGESAVGSLMTPRNAVLAIEASSTQEQVIERLRTLELRKSRLPLYRESLDNIEGILHAKQVLLNPETDYHDLAAPALFVAEDMALLDLIALMKSEHQQIAVVLDVYGSTAGVVSMNDLLGALVGEEEIQSDQDSEGGQG